MNNPAIGDMTCGGCGGAATVHQQSKGKRYLYTKCSKCGIDQRNGGAVQSAIWAAATWRNGPPESKPGNVSDDWKPADVAPPVKDPAEKPATETKPAAAKSGPGTGVFLSAGGLAAIAAAVWLAGQRTKTTNAAPARARGLDERYY